MTWPPRAGASSDVSERAAGVQVTTTNNFPAVRAVLDALATEPDGTLDARAFGRARVLSALFTRLGVPERAWCCENVAGMPPAGAEPAAPAPPVGAPAQRFAAFYSLCATCHATESRFPPNFLAGSGERVAAAVRHCAPRIYVRLAMWRIAAADRAKTPMPPPFPATRSDDYAAPSAVASLAQLAAEIARDETGAVPPVESLPDNAYERLPPCLPGA
jgi:mono/diheme cytochrome c family protein